MIDLHRTPERPETSLSIGQLSEMVGVEARLLVYRVSTWKLPKEGLGAQALLLSENAWLVLKFFASCTPKDIVKEFHLNELTVKALHARGELEGYEFRGRTRFYLESVDRFRQKRAEDKSIVAPEARGLARYSEEKRQEIQALAHKAPKGFVSIPRLAKAMRADTSTLYAQRNKELEVVMFGVYSYVPMAAACKLLKVWRRSLTPTEAAEFVSGISDRVIYYYINNGVVKTTRIFGRERVLRSSLLQASPYLKSRRARKAIGADKSVRVKVSDSAVTRNVMTIEAATEYLGMNVWQTKALVENFTLRRFEQGDEVFVYTSSVEVYKKRMGTPRVLGASKPSAFQDRSLVPPKSSVRQGASIETSVEEERTEELGVARRRSRRYEE